jgi:hypothetical protein
MADKPDTLARASAYAPRERSGDPGRRRDTLPSMRQ